RILTQHRRDFTATLICEHCSATQKLNDGYDDDFFHRNVIPSIKCKSYDKAAPEDYRPLQTKYDASVTI
ncbi:hypothetical protein, partial [Klebsiella pneumoniae]|uniref:hypothetical protein n=1 Tax=Klebsiella pneumoniae TaxID=573 RepID=UPI002731B370